MKIFSKIWIVISFIVLALIILNLINAYISLKYEVEEPKSLGKISDILLEKEKHLKQLIFWFWVLLCFIIGNILVVIKGLLSFQSINKSIGV